MKMLHGALVLLSLSGVFTHSGEYGVKYPDNVICAVKGSNISIPCNYYYRTSNTNIQVTQMLWCSMTSNKDHCHNPPYVYNSSLNTKSDFVYTGDDKSDCTLLIHNVQFSYSGVYKFRFITNETGGSWTGDPGVTLQVTDLKVSLIRLGGNGTLKHGDSLNLTCDVNCTQSSSQFVWSKNNIQLNTSGPVLHFPALTLKDSGNYTCTWKTDTTSGSESISFHVDRDYGVKYPDNVICAVREFRVSIPCTYSYPTSNTNIQVEQMLWCSMTSNKDQCHHPPYVYNSALNTKSDFVYTGDNKSDCTLLIHNVQFSYSGVYKFRFITNKDKWTGDSGVTLQVTDLKVSLIRLSGNGTLKHGDSLNLTCDVNCAQSSSQFVWSKNNIQLQTSGPVLHFPALTLRDSGNYTCTWKTDTTSGSKTVLVQVEGENPGDYLIWMVVLVTAGMIFLIFTVSVIIYKRRRKLNVTEETEGVREEKTETNQELNRVSEIPEEELLNKEVVYSSVQKNKATQSSQLTAQINQVPLSEEDVLGEGGVIYASVYIKPKTQNKRKVHKEAQEQDDSVIYSTVQKT